MPRSVLVLTAEEWERLPWYARQRAVVRELRAHRREHLPHAVESAQAQIDWALGEQESARQALAAMPPDPDAAEHRAVLLAAIRPRRSA